MTRTLESQRVEVYYREKLSYFVRKGQVYHPVRSKASLLKLLADKRSEVNQFIRSANISFKEDRESAIARILKFYETANN